MRRPFFLRPPGAAPVLEGPPSSSPDRRPVWDPPALRRELRPPSSSSARLDPPAPLAGEPGREPRPVSCRSVPVVRDRPAGSVVRGPWSAGRGPRAVARGRSAPIGAPVTWSGDRVRHRAGRVREPDHVRRAVVRWPVYVIFCDVRNLQVAHALAREPRRVAIFPVADQTLTRAGPQKTGRLFAFGG